MRAKKINEFGGAGFSYGGSSMASARPGGINRGGFSGANGMGGSNSMYTYEIKPLNRTLQPEANDSEGEERISKGNDISGLELNAKDDVLHAGTLMDIVTADDGSLMYYIILDPELSRPMKIDPTTARLISKMDGVDPLGVKLTPEEESLVNPGEKSVASMGANKNESYVMNIVKESLYEGISRTYEDFVWEITELMNSNGVRQHQIDDSLDYFHSKGYLEEWWQEGYSPEEAYEEVKRTKYFK